MDLWNASAELRNPPAVDWRMLLAETVVALIAGTVLVALYLG